tara:strand:+ start:43 stop:831 length:789 start_codon:yes stop_codon:yes gene_type:complete
MPIQQLLLGTGGSSAPGPDPLPDIITTNLVTWFDFGKSQCWNGTSTTVTDLSDENNDGTLTGNSSNYSKSTANGGYLDLVNSQSVYSTVELVNSLFTMGTGDFTIEFWLNLFIGPSNTHLWYSWPTDNANEDNARLIFKEQSTNTWRLRVSPALSTAGGWQYRSDVGTFTTSGYQGWWHFVMSRNSGTIKVYINNDEKDSWSNSHNFNYTANNGSHIGYGQSAVSNSLKARLAVYRLYSGKGLTSSEVGDNFDEEKTRFGLS